MPSQSLGSDIGGAIPFVCSLASPPVGRWLIDLHIGIVFFALGMAPGFVK
jgi:hypothetical protein